MYRIAWRLTHGERRLLDITVDDDVSRLVAMQKAVRRDRHTMTAFVRFQRVDVAPDTESDSQPAERYVAWHRPDHYIVRPTTPIYVRRFALVDSVSWDGGDVSFGRGVPASQAPQGDALWRTYNANIFNPARLNLMT